MAVTDLRHQPTFPRDDGGPAYPVFEQWYECHDGKEVARSGPLGGMSLRDHFAGQALFAVIYARIVIGLNTEPGSIAAECYAHADAMIKQRKPAP